MTQPLVFRRVTAVLDAGNQGDGMLAIAAEIAARLHADVQALLLQDTNLHRLVDLGIARMVSRFEAAGPALPPDGTMMLERLAGQAEAALGAAALALGVPWSFQVLQGDASANLPHAIGEGELLVVHVGGGWTGLDARFGSAVWRATETRGASILLVRRQLRRLSPAVLVVEPSAAAAHALAVGAGLLSREQQRLDVLLAATPAEAAATDAWIRARHRVRITAIPDCAVETMTQAARRIGAGLLLIPADAPCLRQPEQIAELADLADCAVLLLR